MSGFCRLPSPHRPGSSHAIGVSAPFTVWAVVPLLAGNNNNRKKNPYKNNRDPTCWLGPFRDFAKKKYRRKWAWPMPKDAADSSEYVGTSF